MNSFGLHCKGVGVGYPRTELYWLVQGMQGAKVKTQLHNFNYHVSTRNCSERLNTIILRSRFPIRIWDKICPTHVSVWYEIHNKEIAIKRFWRFSCRLGLIFFVLLWFGQVQDDWKSYRYMEQNGAFRTLSHTNTTTSWSWHRNHCSHRRHSFQSFSIAWAELGFLSRSYSSWSLEEAMVFCRELNRWARDYVRKFVIENLYGLGRGLLVLISWAKGTGTHTAHTRTRKGRVVDKGERKPSKVFQGLFISPTWPLPLSPLEKALVWNCMSFLLFLLFAQGIGWRVWSVNGAKLARRVVVSRVSVYTCSNRLFKSYLGKQHLKHF